MCIMHMIEEGQMAADKNMHNAHISEQLRVLHDAVLDLVAVINGPRRDRTLIREAGIELDQALFPLLVLTGRYGPIGVVELADRVGRDYTTVSRQLARLEGLGLITRRAAAADRRVRETLITPAGTAMTTAIDDARERLLRQGFAGWEGQDFDTLVRLMRRFADMMKDARIDAE